MEHGAETRIGTKAFVRRIMCDLDEEAGMLREGPVEPAQCILFVVDPHVKLSKIAGRHVVRFGPDGQLLEYGLSDCALGRRKTGFAQGFIEQFDQLPISIKLESSTPF